MGSLATRRLAVTHYVSSKLFLLIALVDDITEIGKGAHENWRGSASRILVVGLPVGGFVARLMRRLMEQFAKSELPVI